jgi:transposase
LDTHPTFGVFFMAKYDESLKLKLVRQYLSGSAGTRELAKQFGVGRSTLRSWIDRHREFGAEGLQRKRHSEYSAQFKLTVLDWMKREALSQQQAAVIFDLRGGGGVIAQWQRQYDEGGAQALKPKPRGRPKKMPKPTQLPPTQADDTHTVQALYKENEALRAEVAYLKKLEALVRANRQAAQKKRKPSSR